MSETEVLMAAGLDAATAEEVRQLVDDADARDLPLDGVFARLEETVFVPQPSELARQARLAWWALDHVPLEFKRLLDARQGGEPVTDEDRAAEVAKAWEARLAELSADGALESRAAFMALGRLLAEVGAGTDAPQSLSEATAYYQAQADEASPARRLVKAYLDAVVAQDPPPDAGSSEEA